MVLKPVVVDQTCEARAPAAEWQSREDLCDSVLYEGVEEYEWREAAHEEQWTERNQRQEGEGEEGAQESDGKDVRCVGGSKSEVENIGKDRIVDIGSRRRLVARPEASRRRNVHQAHEILNTLDVCEPFCAAFAGMGTGWRSNLLRKGRSAF